MMKTFARIAMGVAVALLLLAHASASPISVDGDDADWASPLTTHDDPNGDVTNSGYDIDFIYYDYDQAADRLAFMARTVDQMTHGTSEGGDSVEYVFNSDGDTGTGDAEWHGCLGADYRMAWDLDGDEYTAYDVTSTSHDLLFYAWNSSSSDWTGPIDTIAASDIQIAWGDQGTDFSIIECTVKPSLIGNPKEFTWGCYLDNGGTSSDDYAQDDVENGDDVPEPATWLLLTATAAFGALRRRRT